MRLLLAALAALALAAPAAAATPPKPVAKTQAAILKAAARHDYAALARIIGAKPITFTYGSPEGGPVAYWKRLERRGEKPLATLAALLRQPARKFQGNWVWPPRYARATGPAYYGYRVGITPAGRWLFFVRGD
jgi:hypothetical protein